MVDPPTGAERSSGVCAWGKSPIQSPMSTTSLGRPVSVGAQMVQVPLALKPPVVRRYVSQDFPSRTNWVIPRHLVPPPSPANRRHLTATATISNEDAPPVPPTGKPPRGQAGPDVATVGPYVSPLTS